MNQSSITLDELKKLYALDYTGDSGFVAIRYLKETEYGSSKYIALIQDPIRADKEWIVCFIFVGLNNAGELHMDYAGVTLLDTDNEEVARKFFEVKA